MPDPADELKRKLEELNQAYLQGLPNRLQDIEGAWQASLSADDPGDALKQLHRATHSLVGSAGTFGYDDLSQTARSAERYFKELAEAGITPDAKGRARGEHLIGVLRKKIESLARTETEPAPAAATGEDAGTDHQAGDRTPSLLLVEEDRVLAEQLRLQLQQFGYHVRVLHDPMAIEDTLEAEPAEVLIVDARFTSAEGTGTYHVQHLRETSRLSAPVIFISSEDDFQTRLASVRAGGEMYFPKPVDMRALVERLDALTGKGHATPYRILLIEDEVELREHYGSVLRGAGMEAETLDKVDTLMSTLARFRPELILLDMYMPEASGLELARVIRQDVRYLTTPIVFLSSETDGERQLAAIALGADGFLTKPISDEMLIAAIRARLHRSRLLSSAVSRDSLTGLLNHLRIKEMLDAELSRAQRRDAELTLVMLDIDFFKSVNDRYGHMIGDQIIMRLARMLQERLRSSDIVGRYGGEEFAIILPDTGPHDALRVMDEMRMRFARQSHSAAGERFTVTFSAGIASSVGNSSAREVIEAADRALYDAKTQGRDRVCVSG